MTGNLQCLVVQMTDNLQCLVLQVTGNLRYLDVQVTVTSRLACVSGQRTAQEHSNGHRATGSPTPTTLLPCMTTTVVLQVTHRCMCVEGGGGQGKRSQGNR